MEIILRENEEKFRYIFEKAPTGYALIDLDFKSNLNPAFCKMLGYTDVDLEHLSYFKVIHPDHLLREREQFQKLLTANVKIRYKSEKRYLTVNKDPFWARTTVTVLRDDQNKPKYFLAMIEDITALKQREEEIKAQTLKYKIDDGNLYLVPENTTSLSQSVLLDLKKIGYQGVIFSRTPEKDFISQPELEFDYIWLNKKFSTKKILESLEQVSYKTAILIDRLEYLIVQEGFEKVIRFVYRLNEITDQNNLIAILSIDSSTLTERELRILEKETKPIKPKFLTKISEELLEILRLVFQQNNLGNKPTYSFIGDELRISRPTARKRLKQLVATGYLIEHTKGKSKVLEISTQGRSLFVGKKEEIG
jgi:PAS domain S-box-containing protein